MATLNNQRVHYNWLTPRQSINIPTSLLRYLYRYITVYWYVLLFMNMFDGGFSDLQAHWQSCAFMIHPISTGKALSYDIMEISLWYFSNLFQNSPSSAFKNFSMVPCYVKSINIPWEKQSRSGQEHQQESTGPGSSDLGPCPQAKAHSAARCRIGSAESWKTMRFFFVSTCYISGSKRSMFSVETGAMNWFTLWLFNIAMENGPFIDGLPIKNGDFPWLC